MRWCPLPGPRCCPPARRGTLPYMAPEMIMDHQHVTEKADVWSLGVVFWCAPRCAALRWGPLHCCAALQGDLLGCCYGRCCPWRAPLVGWEPGGQGACLMRRCYNEGHFYRGSPREQAR